ncbi:MAG: hypothetical protein WBA57_27485 [Elainellaceae cyanobacterium]
MEIPLENLDLSFEEYTARLNGDGGDRQYISEIDQHTTNAPSPYSPESVRLHGIVQDYSETRGCSYAEAMSQLNVNV